MDTPMRDKLERQILKFVRRHLEQSGLGNDWEIEPLGSDGSPRLFWRLLCPASDVTFVAMANPPEKDITRAENQAYLHIGQHLHKKGIHVAKILAHNMLRGFFLMDDLGEKNLQTIIKQHEDPMIYYEEALKQLLKLHTLAPQGFDPEWCYQTPSYDRYVMRSLESEYFKRAFLEAYMGLKRDWKELDREFEYLADIVSSCTADSVIHRDFQSRNIIISEDNVGILDWQGARLGPPAYDLASLVIDPYVELDWATRESLYRTYVKAIAPFSHQWAEDLKRFFWYVAIQRNLQILGAFGFLTKKRQKSSFEQYIPAAVLILSRLLMRVQDRSLENLRTLAHELQEKIVRR